MRHTRYLAVVLALAAPCAARPDGVGGHHGDHGAGHHVEHGASAAASAPSTGYAQPSTGYDTPSTGYEQPSASYDAGYEQPAYATGASGYESPSASGYENYEASAPGYGEVETASGGFDLSTLLVPILIIAGLALLFPSVREVPVSGRRKREAGDSTENSLVARVQDIYLAVVESEECMERVACEVGGIAADAGINKGMTKVAESFVPKKYQKMMKNFNSAKDCHKIKCGAF